MAQRTNENAYLAFDLGASSGRAILGWLRNGRMEMEELHRFVTPVREEGERLFWDLDALWEELQSGLSRALERAPDLCSLSVDSWGVDYVPLDASGKPVRPAYCYRDPRTTGLMQRAFKLVPEEEIYAATGIQFMEINTLYQVLADLREEPDLVSRTANRLPIADYFNYRFSGKAVAEVSLASTTQLLEVNRRQWATGLMERFGIPHGSWPEIVPSGTRLGRAAGTSVEVIAGCSHDTACAVAAVPVEAQDEPWAYLSCGTWSLLGVEVAEPLLTDDARRFGVTNEAGFGGTIRLLKNLTGLWALQECEREWREQGVAFTYEQLFQEAEAAPPCDPIDLNDPRFGLRGAMEQRILDYCREHDRPVPESQGALVRLILESIADGHRRVLHNMEALLGTVIPTLYIVGGGSKNDLLCRLTAQACARRVVAGPAEATALGNLLIQAYAMGDLPDGLTIRDVARRSTRLKVYEASEHGNAPSQEMPYMPGYIGS